MPSGDFVNNPLEGYRTLVPNKITQTQPTTKNPQGQGGASVFINLTPGSQLEFVHALAPQGNF